MSQTDASLTPAEPQTPEELLAGLPPELREAFAPEGALAQVVKGFRARPQQLEMAAAIWQTLCSYGVLVSEAGTGTGKTFAYLVPALLAGGKVILSTGTKTLQDQLYNRDLPTVRTALGVPVSTALLKGRANYVCPYYLARQDESGRFATPQEAAAVRAIKRFAAVTTTGDKAECSEVPESSPVWNLVTSTRENCLGQECPEVKNCFVLAARRAAMEADVIVVNHHLFFADLMLRGEGMGELLPACNAVIFDEAHQLPEVATLFFGESVSSAQVVELGRDTRGETLAGAPDCRQLIDASRAIEKAARELRLVFGPQPARIAWQELLRNDAFADALDKLDNALEDFHAILTTQAPRSEGLGNCLRRSEEVRARIARWRGLADVDEGADAPVDAAGEGAPVESSATEADDDRPQGDRTVRWVELFSQSLVLNATPLHVGSQFCRQVEAQPRAWVFTSATLAVGRSFTHYCNEMGLSWLASQPVTGQWGSPFDYAAQAMLFAPAGMPDPNHPDYTAAVARVALPLIRASQGRAFVLCTSLRAMRTIHGLLAEALGDSLPLLLQGEGSRSELLDRFRKHGNAVLVASQSFWEGVDVPGDALSLVIIDKLPFAPPDDPVLAARIEYMRNRGLNPFLHYQLPRTVINMKQGAGRLIRTERDRGLLCICDPRMIDKPYGKPVWRSLPPMRRTRVLDEATAFLAALRTAPPADTSSPT